MKKNEKWLEWAIELQSLAQAGLYYGKDVYDIERFERIREIAAEMISYKTEIPLDTVKDLFCKEVGYQTPKLDTRAAIIENDKILLVQEKSGMWVLPGGWVDIDMSIKQNAVKEVKEEAGLDVNAELVIAVQDRDKHNFPPYAYKICKIFVLCSLIGGEFKKNSETIESGYFGLDELPELDIAKTTKEQIEMCFEAYHAENWTTLFD
ncbi:MAG: NUDIX hydrolase [Ruminococcus sp.]|nr:NUDIX hydrolase [Ruminococcus sp.]